MQSPHANVNSISGLATGNGTDATPFSQQSVVLTQQAYSELTWKAHSWQAQHARSVEREAALLGKVASLEATIRDVPQRLSGTKSEQSAGPADAAESKPSCPRPRGQQPGSKGHGRSERSARLVGPEVHDLCAEAQHCPACGAAFLPFPGAEESSMSAVQGQAHIRRLQRLRYQQVGQCPQGPGMVTAPPAPRVIPKSPRGVSLWTMVLLDQYLYGRPTSRFCEPRKPPGVPLSQGTLTEGLQKIAGLLEPVLTKL
jgi:transposase